MKFATPLTALALFVTRRNCSADAAGPTGDGLIDSEVGWNEKVRGYIHVGVGVVSQRAFLYHFLFLYLRCTSISTQLLNFLTIIYQEHHFPVGRRLQALQIFKNNLDLSLCLNWDHQNITHPSLVSLRTCDGSPAQS